MLHMGTPGGGRYRCRCSGSRAGRGGGKRGSIRAASARIAKVSDKDLLYKTIAVAKHHKPWLVVNVGSGVSMLKLDEQVRLGCRV